MSVYQKNVTMLTVLLVHEADHILNFAFSSVVKKKGMTPHRKYELTNERKFTDVGHLMERSLYGFSIQHGYDGLVAHPFAIDEILGMKEEVGVSKYILRPCDIFLQMISNPEHKGGAITLDTLRFAPTSGVAYEQRTITPVVLAGAAGDTKASRVESPPAARSRETIPEWLADIATFQGKE